MVAARACRGKLLIDRRPESPIVWWAQDVHGSRLQAVNILTGEERLASVEALCGSARASVVLDHMPKPGDWVESLEGARRGGRARRRRLAA